MDSLLHRLNRLLDRLFGKRIGGWLRFSGRAGLNTVHLYSEIDGEQRAASFAYYVLFSIFPLCALILTTGSAFFGSADVVETIKVFSPSVRRSRNSSGKTSTAWNRLAAG